MKIRSLYIDSNETKNTNHGENIQMVKEDNELIWEVIVLISGGAVVLPLSGFFPNDWPYICIELINNSNICHLLLSHFSTLWFASIIKDADMLDVGWWNWNSCISSSDESRLWIPLILNLLFFSLHSFHVIILLASTAFVGRQATWKHL